MGPRSSHTAHEGDMFPSPRDERTLVRKVQINPRTTAKDFLLYIEDLLYILTVTELFN